MKRLDYFHEYWRRINSLSVEQRQNLMDFGMGMPDPTVFVTPDIILNQLSFSISSGDYNKYIPTEGNCELLQEIVTLENHRLSDEALKYDLSNVMLVPGGIQGFALLTEVLLTPGDGVLVPNPSYFSLTALSEERYRVDVVQSSGLNFSIALYKDRFSKNIRLAWFCNPNNPTGLYIPSEDLAGIIDCADIAGAYVILDESCDNHIHGEAYQFPSNISNTNVVRIRTFSKEPNLSGYRLGYILGSSKIIDRLKRFAPIVYGNPNVMALRAVYTEMCIKNGKFQDRNYTEITTNNCRLVKEARDFLYEELRQHPSVQRVILPESCYYMFAKFDFESGSQEFTKILLEQQLLDVVPGTVFGTPNSECWIRMCFARNPQFLELALKKIDFVLRGGVTNPDEIRNQERQQFSR